MDVPFEWEEETKVVDPAVYRQMGDDGLLICLAFGAKIPQKWAKPDGTVFGGVKVDEWDGLCVSIDLLRQPRMSCTDRAGAE